MAAKTAAPLIQGRDQLVADLERGCKPRSAFRIGTEHEKFIFRRANLSPAPYDGEAGIGALLQALVAQGPFTPVLEDGNVIALTGQDGSSITLEPGGQFEMAGTPRETLHQTCAEVNQHLTLLSGVTESLGLGMLGMGFHPTAPRKDIPWMPKGRYAIMREHMPKVGNLGLDMMLRTCTIQCALDFADEADMVQKLRVALSVQPIVTALFANAPLTESKPNGFKSYRAHIWTDTDPQRCGNMPFVFEDGMGFERYVDYLLDVPMYFVKRGSRHINAAGKSFRAFMDGKLDVVPGERPTMADWEDQLSVAFPEVRLKHYLELRGADGGPWNRICALPAFWTGLLYNSGSLDQAWQMVKDWTQIDRDAALHDTARLGLEASVARRPVLDLARDLLALARQGLKDRAQLNREGLDETLFLNPLDEMVDTGMTLADRTLALYHGIWDGDASKVFEALAY